MNNDMEVLIYSDACNRSQFVNMNCQIQQQEVKKEWIESAANLPEWRLK